MSGMVRDKREDTVWLLMAKSETANASLTHSVWPLGPDSRDQN